MKLCTAKETAERWNISERMVRRFCVDGRIPEAKLENGTWMIPASATKPKRKPMEKKAESAPNLTVFAKRVVYQRSKNKQANIIAFTVSDNTLFAFSFCLTSSISAKSYPEIMLSIANKIESSIPMITLTSE